jgi:hypothetical protein
MDRHTHETPPAAGVAAITLHVTRVVQREMVRYRNARVRAERRRAAAQRARLSERAALTVAVRS